MQMVADMRGIEFKYIAKYADILCGWPLMEVNLKDDILLKSKIYFTTFCTSQIHELKHISVFLWITISLNELDIVAINRLNFVWNYYFCTNMEHSLNVLKGLLIVLFSFLTV
jgi:hypothetical protein